MTDIIVSRIQNRRGLQVDLPQPLRPGELGWCLDTARLFIGSDPDHVSSPFPGIEVFSGQITTAQSILDTQIIEVAYGVGFDFEAFKQHMEDTDALAPLTAVSSDYIQQGESTVFVGLNEVQNDDIAEYITYINSFANVISSHLASFEIGPDGILSLSSHNDANALAVLLNELGAATGTCTTRLNVEILTEVYSGQEEIPLEYSLPPSASFTTFMVYASEMHSDVFHIDYSCNIDDNAGNYYLQAGQMYVIGSTNYSQANLQNNFVDISGGTQAAGSIDYQAVINGTNIEIQYRSTKSLTATFKTYTKRWQSF